jgi:uncharacterized membrane protein YkvA (DUF1232 family)
MDNTENTGKKVMETSFFKRMMNRAEDYLNRPTRLKQLLNEAYQRAQKQKNLGTIATGVWENFQQLFRMIKASTSGQYHGVEKKTLLGGIAVLIYLLTPIDLVPDFIPVIGMLDDAALLAWFLTSIKTELDHFVEWEKTKSEKKQEEGPLSKNREQEGEHSSEEENAPNGLANTGGEGKLLIEDLTITGTQAKKDSGQENDIATTSSNPEPSPTGAAPTGAGEPQVRANTTDSTRLPSGNRHDATSGGNVR